MIRAPVLPRGFFFSLVCVCVCVFCFCFAFLEGEGKIIVIVASSAVSVGPDSLPLRIRGIPIIQSELLTVTSIFRGTNHMLYLFTAANVSTSGSGCYPESVPRPTVKLPSRWVRAHTVIL